MAQRQFDLAHPPRNRLRGELPAIVEPALRDMPEFSGFDVGDIELVDSERVEPDDRFPSPWRSVALVWSRCDGRRGDDLVDHRWFSD